MLPDQFTLSELQAVYEAILGKKLDKRNFRKKLELLGVLKATSAWRKTGRKPARLKFLRQEVAKSLRTRKFVSVLRQITLPTSVLAFAAPRDRNSNPGSF